MTVPEWRSVRCRFGRYRSACGITWWNEEGIRYKHPKYGSVPQHLLEVGRMTVA